MWRFKQSGFAYIPAIPALLLMACAGPGAPSRSAVNMAELYGTEWVLSSLNGRPVVAESRITLEIDSAGLGGYGGCNWYGGSYTATDTTFTLGEVSSTARACLAPGLMEQETAYHAALSRSKTFHRSGDRLDLRDAGDNPVLIFTGKTQLPMNPADLLGTSWRLQSINETDPIPGSNITLALSEQGVSGFAGCRNYIGTYTAEGDDIRFTSMNMTETECNAGEALLLQEGQYTTDLSEATDYRLSGGRLEIYTAPGRTLVFTAAN